MSEPVTPDADNGGKIRSYLPGERITILYLHGRDRFAVSGANPRRGRECGSVARRTLVMQGWTDISPNNEACPGVPTAQVCVSFPTPRLR